MDKNPGNVTIMFADIAGSTRLYELLGDRKARDIIARVLGDMTRIAESQAGVLVNTIGDEILCRFAAADQAVSAAIHIQIALQNLRYLPGLPFLARIGLQTGPVVMDRGNVYGDAVNVAARMTGIAKGGQIITATDTVAELSPALAVKTRLYDSAFVGGKSEALEIYQVLWDAEEATGMIRFDAMRGAADTRSLVLWYGESKKVISTGTTVMLGRADQCDVIVRSTTVSRHHAKIEFRRGKFVLVDQSTNGTFVRTEDGKDFYLRREELPLWGQGILSLGEEIQEDSRNIIRFSLSG